MNNQTISQRPFVLHTRVVTGTGGGPEKTILNSPRFLKEHCIDSACLFMRPPGDPGFESLEQKAKSANAPIIGVDDNGPLDRSVISRCLKVCQDKNVTVWHAHDYKSNAVGLMVKRHHPMHLVTTTHGWVRKTWKTPLYYAIDRFCLKRYQQVICVSQDLYDACQKLSIAKDRLHLIDNAIVADDYDTSAATESERSEFDVPAGRILLGACGRLSEEKGFGLLITAVEKLVKEGFDVGLVIAGEGHLKEQLQQQIDELGMQERIRLAGFLSDPRRLYRAIDVFVLSSLREGLPNVVLEAMATGRTVLATRVNGIPRLVTDGQNGIVIDCDSVQQLHSGLQTILNDADLRAQLAAAGRQTVETNFSFRQRMDRMVKVYDKLPKLHACRTAIKQLPQIEAAAAELTSTGLAPE